MALSPDQRETIATLALKHGVDRRFLAALQQAENGPRLEDGTQGFGVLAAGARTTFEKNGDWAARTIRRTISRFVRNHEVADWWDEAKARYSAGFIHYFSRGGAGYPGYAPLGADNDPTDLNAHHVANLTRFYDQECAA